MNARFATFACLLLASTIPGHTAPPPKELVNAIKLAIQTHSPDASIGVDDEKLTAKHGTMSFTVHGHSKTGEISPQTGIEEGPNFKGFLLKLSVHEGAYQGAAVVPQTLGGPYWTTFINAVPTPDGKGHYWIAFAEGKQLDPKLRAAIFKALPAAPAKK